MTSFYKVTVFINVGDDNFRGYTPKAPIAEVDSFHFTASDPLDAAERMFEVGNKMANDHLDKSYPRDVRSLSVGDLVKVEDQDGMTFYSVDSFGWTEIPEPINPVVQLAGRGLHTSRQ